MITNPTAFILGAGASKPYGYSLGSELMEGMIQDRFGMKSVLQNLGCEQDVIADFRNSLTWCGLNSIDAYLARVKRHETVGRLALANQLLNEDSRATNFSKDWLGYIWRVLIEGITEPAEFAKNRLSIVTFNYDTSVERFLVNALKYTFDLTLDKAVNFAAAIQVVHVYGSLPIDEYGTERLVAAPPLLDRVAETAKRIIVLHEGTDDSAELEQARAILLQAEVRVFLGFGYIEENVRRLKLSRWIKPGKQGAFGTVYGLSAGEIRQLQRMFPTTHPLTTNPGTCEDGVRFWVDSFTAAPP